MRRPAALLCLMAIVIVPGAADLVISGNDGRLVVAAVVNGSNVADDSPIRTENGLVVLFGLIGANFEHNEAVRAPTDEHGPITLLGGVLSHQGVRLAPHSRCAISSLSFRQEESLWLAGSRRCHGIG